MRRWRRNTRRRRRGGEEDHLTAPRSTGGVCQALELLETALLCPVHLQRLVHSALSKSLCNFLSTFTCTAAPAVLRMAASWLRDIPCLLTTPSSTSLLAGLLQKVSSLYTSSPHLGGGWGEVR